MLMGLDSRPENGICQYRKWDAGGETLPEAMKRKPIQEILAANLNALMRSRPDLDTSLKLAKAAGVGNGTIGRIRNGEVACGIDTVSAIAEKFGLEPWQLLVQDLEPGNPPVLKHPGVKERELYARLEALMKEMQK